MQFVILWGRFGKFNFPFLFRFPSFFGSVRPDTSAAAWPPAGAVTSAEPATSSGSPSDVSLLGAGLPLRPNILSLLLFRPFLFISWIILFYFIFVVRVFKKTKNKKKRPSSSLRQAHYTVATDEEGNRNVFSADYNCSNSF
jgi:hypothetical protein